MIRYSDSIDRLKKTGFTEEQAVAQLTVFEDFMTNKVATSEDLQNLRVEMHDIRIDLRNEIVEINDTLNKLNLKLDKIEYRIIIKLGSFIGAIEAIKYFCS